MTNQVVTRTSAKCVGRFASLFACCGTVMLLLVGVVRPGETRTAHKRAVHGGTVIPAFARKYGLACSACHTAWPELNSFGQAFKDNGYQLGNERDSPIFQSPAYWPIALRTTPQLHLERTTNQPVDRVPGDSSSGLVERTISPSGFDLSGIDFLTLGTLYKNVSFALVPSMESGGAFHIESAWVRFDNLVSSPWLNVKLGKFELDNLLSEKRIVTLSNNGGLYQSYHFSPIGDANDFGLGDNQLGLELMGHNLTSYTRYSVALLSSNSGNPGLPAGSTYDGAVTLSQAYQAGRLGLHRVGVYGYAGQRATTFRTTGGMPIPGTGMDSKPFYRVGATGSFFFGDLELLPFFMHASDDAYLATGTPGTDTLPSGARSSVWNAGLIEAHFVPDPQLALIARYETVRMSRQAFPDAPSELGNVDALTAGVRAYPFMFSRAGVALHLEYSLTNNIGRIPMSGDGVGLPPLLPRTKVRSSSLLFGLDFAF